MGMDLLDMAFRIERYFGIRIPRGAWEPVGRGRNPFHFTAKELALFVAERLEQARLTPVPPNTRCPDCRHNLGGLPPDGECPRCGTPILYTGLVWWPLRQIIVDCLGCDPGEVHEEAFLRKDLGAEW